MKRAIFGYHFAQLSRMMLAVCKPGIVRLGIQPCHMPFVAELLHCKIPVTQDELAMGLSIDKGTTARALDRLERDGFISREVNPENRRQKLVVATQKARAIEEDLYRVLHDSSRMVMQNLSIEEADQLLNLLNQIIGDSRIPVR